MADDSKPGRLTDSELADVIGGTEPPPPIAEAMRDAHDDVRMRPTLHVCRLCRGTGLVEPEVNVEYQRRHDLALLVESVRAR